MSKPREWPAFECSNGACSNALRNAFGSQLCRACGGTATPASDVEEEDSEPGMVHLTAIAFPRAPYVTATRLFRREADAMRYLHEQVIVLADAQPSKSEHPEFWFRLSNGAYTMKAHVQGDMTLATCALTAVLPGAIPFVKQMEVR